MNQYYQHTRQNPYYGGASPMQPAVFPQYQYPQYPHRQELCHPAGAGQLGHLEYLECCQLNNPILRISFV